MPIIKLNATDSTNSYLKDLCGTVSVKDFTVVVSESQINGRGQMGSSWQSESGKNLTCSVFKRIKHLNLEDNFYLSMVVSLAIINTLNYFKIPKLKIKWPNDILSEQKKICGILIENVIKNNQFEASILGIGLNVNQLVFDNLPKATSMQQITGIVYDLDEVLHHLLNALAHYFKLMNDGNKKVIKNRYLELLFKRDKPSTFKDVNGQMFTGIIQGISPSGQLKVLLEDDIVQLFNFKEVELLY